MELLQLEYFYAVAQNQHMTRTAEQLHIAQPSLTQSIRRLEKELGVPLFYRSGRNIALTTYGEALQNALTPVLKTLHQIPTQLQQMALEREKTIRLNVLAASTLVTQALISYKKDHDGSAFPADPELTVRGRRHHGFHAGKFSDPHRYQGTV